MIVADAALTTGDEAYLHLSVVGARLGRLNPSDRRRKGDQRAVLNGRARAGGRGGRCPGAGAGAGTCARAGSCSGPSAGPG